MMEVTEVQACFDDTNNIVRKTTHKSQASLCAEPPGGAGCCTAIPADVLTGANMAAILTGCLLNGLSATGQAKPQLPTLTSLQHHLITISPSSSCVTL
ncbi:hypothetical protein E2C01_050045 [Portunus trituberculatus]|uniref:Uncharacterized protein n=1 Tax=Portunus trituberculatus TaxID=210409 RepID=A0A5B7GFG7_PORTR|nr:hypothetical protein [Portunus trituberculatus]